MATTFTGSGQEYVPKQWETVPCPFCDSSSFKPHERFGPDHRYSYVQCRECRLVYENPRPLYDESFIRTAYSVYDTDSFHLKFGGSLNTAERNLVEKYKITLRQAETLLGRRGRLLDIGCATGLFLLAAQEMGWEPEGIDISASMATAAHQLFGFPTHSGQYHETRFDKTFNLIYCSHVIEHIPNPNDWVAKFARDLSPNGILCLNIPNQFSLDRRLKRGLKKLGLKKDRWARWRTPDHLYEPHFRPMRYLLEKHGFQIIKAMTYSKDETDGTLSSLYHEKLRAGSKLRIFAKLAG